LENAQVAEVRSGAIHDGDLVVVGSRAGLQPGNKVQTKLIAPTEGTVPKP
jgi:hypothetical protein